MITITATIRFDHLRAASMAVMNIRLFGQLSVSCGDKALEGSIPRKASELFCYLLTHPQRPITREALAEILWNNSTEQHSKQYLRKSLWQLQRTIATCTTSAHPILDLDSHWVSISPQANIWIDTWELERVVADAQSPSWRLDSSNIEIFESALNLYKGDLLEGWYYDWCLYERERLQNMYLMALEKLVDYCETHKQCERGISAAQKILGFDRSHEIAHQHLMRLRFISGDRAGALRQYKNCVLALKEELNIGPSKHTTQLYQQIREDCREEILGPVKGHSLRPEEPPSPLRGAVAHLEEVKDALTNLQRAIDETRLYISQALRSDWTSRIPESKKA
jgi:DNA-binding SARP family transcriptional activator